MGQPPRDHVCVANKNTKAAAAARIGAELAGRKRDALLGLLRPCFARVEPFVQARKYVRAVISDLPARNGWSIAEFTGDESPDKTQRLLNRASWDALAAMSVVRKVAVEGLEEAARRRGRRRGPIRFPPWGNYRAWLLHWPCRRCRPPPSVRRPPRAAGSVPSPADARPGRTRPPRCLPDCPGRIARLCGRGICHWETERRAIQFQTPRSYPPPYRRWRCYAATDPPRPRSDRTPRQTVRSARHRPDPRHKVRRTRGARSGAIREPVTLRSSGGPQSSRSPLHSDRRLRSHWNPAALCAHCPEQLLFQSTYTLHLVSKRNPIELNQDTTPTPGRGSQNEPKLPGMCTNIP